MIQNTTSEKCYYCNNKAEYSELVGDNPSNFTVGGVCRVHLKMNLSS
jgi:hypothetical protein